MKQPVIVVFRFSVKLLLLSAMKFGLDKPISSFAVFSKTLTNSLHLYHYKIRPNS